VQVRSTTVSFWTEQIWNGGGETSSLW